jgi:hypothetical protein
MPKTSAPKIRGRRECGANDAPAASRAIKTKHTSVVTTVTPETSGIPRAMVLTASFVLSPGTGLSCPRRPQDHRLAGLTPASGRQDHTTSPYAAALSSGLTTIEPDAATSIASRAQRVVTIAIRPSVGHETAAVLKLICPTAKAENFCERDWTLMEMHRSAEVICPSGKWGCDQSIQISP